jgi:hypothetical protein
VSSGCWNSWNAHPNPRLSRRRACPQTSPPLHSPASPMPPRQGQTVAAAKALVSHWWPLGVGWLCCPAAAPLLTLLLLPCLHYGVSHGARCTGVVKAQGNAGLAVDSSRQHCNVAGNTSRWSQMHRNTGASGDHDRAACSWLSCAWCAGHPCLLSSGYSSQVPCSLVPNAEVFLLHVACVVHPYALILDIQRRLQLTVSYTTRQLRQRSFRRNAEDFSGEAGLPELN